MLDNIKIKNLSDIAKEAFGSDRIHYTHVSEYSGVFCFTEEPLLTFVIGRCYSEKWKNWKYMIRKTQGGKSVAKEFAVDDPNGDDVLFKLRHSRDSILWSFDNWEEAQNESIQ